MCVWGGSSRRVSRSGGRRALLLGHALQALVRASGAAPHAAGAHREEGGDLLRGELASGSEVEVRGVSDWDGVWILRGEQNVRVRVRGVEEGWEVAAWKERRWFFILCDGIAHIVI